MSSTKRPIQELFPLMYGELRKKTGNEPKFSAARLRWP